MSIDWLLVFIRDFALALWLGGLIVIDFVEAPAKFRVAEINRNQAVAVGRAVFAALNRLETMLGAALLAASLLLLRRTVQTDASQQIAVAAVGAMWLIALVQFFRLRPRMTEIARDLDLVNRRPGDERYGALARLHRAYVVCDVAKIALGLLAFVLWIERR